MGLTGGSAWCSGSAVTAAESPLAQPQALCSLQQQKDKSGLSRHPLRTKETARALVEGGPSFDLLTCSLRAITRPSPGAWGVSREEKMGIGAPG